MIQRYSIETPPFAKGYMVPDDNGEFCRYEERFDSDPDVPGGDTPDRDNGETYQYAGIADKETEARHRRIRKDSEEV